MGVDSGFTNESPGNNRVMHRATLVASEIPQEAVQYCRYLNTVKPRRTFPGAVRVKFSVFHLALPRIADLYGDELQHWSHSSANAEAIFDADTDAQLRLVRTWYEKLTNPSQDGGCCATKTTRRGTLTSDKSFCSLLEKEATDFIYTLV